MAAEAAWPPRPRGRRGRVAAEATWPLLPRRNPARPGGDPLVAVQETSGSPPPWAGPSANGSFTISSFTNGSFTMVPGTMVKEPLVKEPLVKEPMGGGCLGIVCWGPPPSPGDRRHRTIASVATIAGTKRQPIEATHSGNRECDYL